MIIGILILFLGLLLLLRNLGIIELPTSVWSILYPLAVIVIGLYMIIFSKRGREWRKSFSKKDDVGDGTNTGAE